jgi:hypothetical protein
MSKDWNDAYSRGFDAKSAADCVWAKVNKVYPPSGWREQIINAADLQCKTFPAIKYVVKGLLPEGLGMLAGRPKIGKSWAALDIGSAVASTDGTCLGGLEVEHGDVLYCALEDSHRRLQSRLTKLLGAHKDEWPRRLQLTTNWQRLDKGGGERHCRMGEACPNPGS